jgi:hypothetical protein
VGPLLQQLEFKRLIEPKYVKELFVNSARSLSKSPVNIRLGRGLRSRDATVRNQMMQIVGPALGKTGWRDTILDWRVRKPSHEQWLNQWVRMHAPPGALGFALAQDAFWLLFPPLLVASFCCICLRLVPPRPPWATLVRQPGWCACLGSILGVMLGYAEGVLFEKPVPSIIVPATVLLAWVVLAVSRQWQPERSWIDRAGRLVGVCWIATIPIYVIGFVWS